MLKEIHKHNDATKEFSQKAETLLKEDLEREGILKKYPGIKIHYIGEGIIASGIGRVEMYNHIDANFHLTNVFNLQSIRTDYFFDTAAAISGFREIRTPTGVLELFQVQDIDTKTGNPLPNTSPVPNLDIAYFRAWETVSFVCDTLAIHAWKHPNSE